jgi:hypothetical protein
VLLNHLLDRRREGTIHAFGAGSQFHGRRL